MGRGRRRIGWLQRSTGKEGGLGGVSFYFDGKGEEEDSPSELDDDLDSSEEKWGAGR